MCVKMQNLFGQTKILPFPTTTLLQTAEFVYNALKAPRIVGHFTDELRTNVSEICSLRL
jgi:hypothetical protein